MAGNSEQEHAEQTTTGVQQALNATLRGFERGFREAGGPENIKRLQETLGQLGIRRYPASAAHTHGGAFDLPAPAPTPVELLDLDLDNLTQGQAQRLTILTSVLTVTDLLPEDTIAMADWVYRTQTPPPPDGR